MGSVNTDRPARKRRDRARTEADLLAAARRLLERDGVLAGLNLQEVAAEAEVNRGQIYQFYGSRRALLRAALADVLGEVAAANPGHWEHDFAERQRHVLRWMLSDPWVAHMGALLALDGDDEFHPLASLSLTREALDRDRASGALPPEADAEALHVLVTSAILGYVVFRESLARDTGIPLPELDDRVKRAYDQTVERMTGE